MRNQDQNPGFRIIAGGGGRHPSKKLISEILNFGLDFSVSFLDEFLLDFAGTFSGRSIRVRG